MINLGLQMIGMLYMLALQLTPLDRLAAVVKSQSIRAAMATTTYSLYRATFKLGMSRRSWTIGEACLGPALS
jgi:hypothetical protein